MFTQKLIDRSIQTYQDLPILKKNFDVRVHSITTNESLLFPFEIIENIFKNLHGEDLFQASRAACKLFNLAAKRVGDLTVLIKTFEQWTLNKDLHALLAYKLPLQYREHFPAHMRFAMCMAHSVGEKNGIIISGNHLGIPLLDLLHSGENIDIDIPLSYDAVLALCHAVTLSGVKHLIMCIEKKL